MGVGGGGCFFYHLGGCKIGIVETINGSEWAGSDIHTNQRAVAAGRQQVQWAGVCDEHTHKHTHKQTDTTFVLIYRIPDF